MKTLSSLLLGALVAVGLAGCVGGHIASLPESATPPPADAARYGDYLSARLAELTLDTDNAAIYYERVWQRDKNNTLFLERAVQAHIIAGRIDMAVEMARQASPQTLDEANITKMLLLVVNFGQVPVEALRASVQLSAFDRMYGVAIRNLLDWADPDSVPERDLKSGWVTLYNHAFLQMARGEYGQALAMFEQIWRAGGRWPVAARAYVRLLAAMGKKQEARTIADSFALELVDAPLAQRLASQLAAGEQPEIMSLTPRQGAALAMLAPSLSATGKYASNRAILLLRLAIMLDPQLDMARFRLAGHLADAERYDNAFAVLDQIGESSAYNQHALIRRAFMLLETEQHEKARHFAQKAREITNGRYLQFELGRLFLSLEEYEQAEAVFSEIITADRMVGRVSWRARFLRGQSLERQGKWDLAEDDLQQALILAPDRPELLNYLGYSWLDRGENVEKAFSFIRRAALARPNSGSIIDSLGWAYFRLGRYNDAIIQLERAVELEPSDPVITDHLGDAYWRAGRAREARYQWQRALGLDPDAALRSRISYKLDSGL